MTGIHRIQLALKRGMPQILENGSSHCAGTLSGSNHGDGVGLKRCVETGSGDLFGFVRHTEHCMPKSCARVTWEKGHRFSRAARIRDVHFSGVERCRSPAQKRIPRELFPASSSVPSIRRKPISN
jgi:hypothetical protein